MAKNRIGTLRRENGLNQRELGMKLGVGQTTVSAWETGKNEPDNESMHKMANFFKCSIGYLMGYESESLTRGLSKEEYNRVQSEIRKRIDEEEIVQQIREYEEGKYSLTQKEIEEIEEAEALQRWKNSNQADTLEGFLASEIIDNKPAKERDWLLKTLIKIADHP